MIEHLATVKHVEHTGDLRRRESPRFHGRGNSADALRLRRRSQTAIAQDTAQHPGPFLNAFCSGHHIRQDLFRCDRGSMNGKCLQFLLKFIPSQQQIVNPAPQWSFRGKMLIRIRQQLLQFRDQRSFHARLFFGKRIDETVNPTRLFHDRVQPSPVRLAMIPETPELRLHRRRRFFHRTAAVGIRFAIRQDPGQFRDGQPGAAELLEPGKFPEQSPVPEKTD